MDNLEEVGSALLEIQRWGDEGAVHRSPLRSAGPWRQKNMAVAWKLYFQEQGLAPYIRCEHEHCQTVKPIIVKTRQQTGEHEFMPGERRLIGFCCQCWRETSFRHGKDQVADMSFLKDAGVFSTKLTERVGDSSGARSPNTSSGSSSAVVYEVANRQDLTSM